jgi:hypothetical protein
MKTQFVLPLIALATIGASVSAKAAPNCNAEVTAIAQMNLAFLAKSISTDFDASVANPKLVAVKKVKVINGVYETDLTYHLDGEIYKGPYNVLVTVDSDCLEKSVSLQAIAN